MAVSGSTNSRDLPCHTPQLDSAHMGKHLSHVLEVPDYEWEPFPGGELEGRRPPRLCPECRTGLNRQKSGSPRAAGNQPLCFQCYRLELDRERALHAAANLDTASEARFQETLPFEPVDRGRLLRLKVDRLAAREVSRSGFGRFEERRRQAQLAARRALLAILGRGRGTGMPNHDYQSAVDAAELQLPESWLPFVVSR
jgi:hypothetical protein